MRLHYLLRLLVFWLLMFTLFRVLLMLGHSFSGHAAIWGASMQSLVAGIRLDISTIAYFMLPSLLLWALYQWISKPVLKKITHAYHLFLIFCISILGVANVKMYEVWESLLNVSVINYIVHPGEVLSFIKISELLILIVLWMAIFSISILLYRQIVSRELITGGTKAATTVTVLLALPFLGIAARGGLQLIPVNESSAYFSETPFYNHVSVNPNWYFIHSFLETESTENPFLFMDMELAETKNRALFSTAIDSSVKILNTDRPNIIFIVLESWTADIIEALDGEQGVTPQFDILRKEGLLFTNLYAAGSRTEHGLISILSGYPPPPHNSIITVPYKVEKLGSISELLYHEGYETSFYYGGEIGFANMKSYLVNEHFNLIIDKNAFEGEQLNSKWGAHDEFVFEKQLQELGNMKEPFFSMLLTLSTHEPFEVPMETPFNGDTDPDKFRKSAYYADHCLGQYFEKAKKEDWYSRTLFVLVADHGHKLPKKKHLNLPSTKRVPLLLMGGALDDHFKGQRVEMVANQHDIVATLLRQLDMDARSFSRSRDLLNPGIRQFAYYTNDNVMGWVTPEQMFIYPYATKKPRVIRNDLSQVEIMDTLLLDAKAYLQTHYEAYLAY